MSTSLWYLVKLNFMRVDLSFILVSDTSENLMEVVVSSWKNAPLS